MEHLTVVIGISTILLLGLLLFQLSLHLAKRRMAKKVSVRSLFLNFHQKIYMTAGLGIFFFSLYFCSVPLLSLWIESKGRVHCFNFLLNHLVEFIYLGLICFTFITISIYLVRMAIKSRYNSRRR
jgi:hypothetical protein